MRVMKIANNGRYPVISRDAVASTSEEYDEISHRRVDLNVVVLGAIQFSLARLLVSRLSYSVLQHTDDIYNNEDYKLIVIMIIKVIIIILNFHYNTQMPGI